MIVSVVVAGNGDERTWRRCLEALIPQVDAESQVIAAVGGAPEAVALIERDFPAVERRFRHCGPQAWRRPAATSSLFSIATRS